MSKNKLFRFFTSNWTITLFATMFGVFAGIFANDWIASSKLEKQKTIATRNILEELANNSEKMQKAVAKHESLYEVIGFFDEFYDEDQNLILTVNRMQKFRSKHPNVIQITDSISIGNEKYKYKGDLNLDLDLPQLVITNIAWSTLKSSGLSSSYGFNCMMYLESIDKMEKEIIQKNSELLDVIIKASGVNDESLIGHMKLLIDFEKALIKVYEIRKDELKECR